MDNVMDNEIKALLAALVRTGRVTAVDQAKKQVRVLFAESGMTSGWLYVLQHGGGDLVIKPDGQHTHSITDTYTGGGSAGTEPNHAHTGSTTAVWLPKVNEQVLVLYLPVFCGDGFVLGSIG